MAEVIKLLPDHLANQIAAGEVIQRPASVVKELMENALDAGATTIQLIIEDAGKKLVQVVDDGCGMDPLDARMSFERHATSKIKNIEDLFSIRTMGFRGEALASIAAVAQVTLRTKTKEDELGTLLEIEASEVKKQEPVATPNGTNFCVRNLFYNVPARRKFLKSNNTEYRHILDEFTRIALAFPEREFRLFNNNTEQFHLTAGSLKNRILELLGGRLEKSLIPVDEDMEWLKIQGFIGKPQAATRTRGNQFFFVNNRFIKSPYLNHAVTTGFDNMIDKEAYPLYLLRLTIDPEKVDINVHPTKQEVKFDDERIIYAFLQSAVKQVLARNNIMPSIDFTLNPEIQNLDSVRLPFSGEEKAKAGAGFLAKSFSEAGKAHFIETRQDRQNWEQQRKALFPELGQASAPQFEKETNRYEQSLGGSINQLGANEKAGSDPIVYWKNYLVTTIKSGFLVIHRLRALERISYESLERRMQGGNAFSQKLLFPFEMEWGPTDKALIKEAEPFFKQLGFNIAQISDNVMTINGLPNGLNEEEARRILEDLVNTLKIEPEALEDPLHKDLLKTMAKGLARSGIRHPVEGQALIDELFACTQPNVSPFGKQIFHTLREEDLSQLLK